MFMKVQKNMYEMSERELRSRRRSLKLRRERKKRLLTMAGSILTALFLILVCAVSYESIQSKANSGFKYYTSITVEAGESLWSLADEYIDYDYYKDKNAYIAEVQSINHLDEKGSISAGQILIVPYYSPEYVN